MNWDAARERKTPGSVEQRIFDSLRTLETLRASHRVFDQAADAWLPYTGDDGVLAIGRYYQGEKLLALFNFSESERYIYLGWEEGDFTDLLTGEKKDVGALELPSGGFMWLLCDFDKPAEETRA